MIQESFEVQLTKRAVTLDFVYSTFIFNNAKNKNMTLNLWLFAVLSKVSSISYNA